jgi:hypothetical protein
MEVALASMQACQKAGGVVTFLMLEKHKQHMQLKLPLAFVLGDAKSSYGGRNTKRICRACDVSFQQSGNVNYRCFWILHNRLLAPIKVDFSGDSKFTRQQCAANDNSEDQWLSANRTLFEGSQHKVDHYFQDMDFPVIVKIHPDAPRTT